MWKNGLRIQKCYKVSENMGNEKEKALAYQKREHERNQKRIKNGLLSFLIVPSVFLVLLFLSNVTGTNKLVMLLVWIASMFIIAAYLIVVEFVDYKVMHMFDEEEDEEKPEG